MALTSEQLAWIRRAAELRQRTQELLAKWNREAAVATDEQQTEQR